MRNNLVYILTASILLILITPAVSGFYFSIKSGYDNYGERQINIVLTDTYQAKYYDYYNYGYNKKDYYTPEKTRETIYKLMDNLENYEPYLQSYDASNKGNQLYADYYSEKTRWRYKKPYDSDDYAKDAYKRSYYYTPRLNKQEGYFCG